MFPTILKIGAAVAIVVLTVLLLVQVLPYLLVALAVVGVWKLFQAFTNRSPRTPSQWR